MEISHSETRMTDFQTVCKIGDLHEGEGKTVVVGNRCVALFLIDGKPCAIDDACPPMGASLSGAYVEGGIVPCPWHGWRFRATDATWADNPRVKTRSYPVRVVG